MRRASYTVGDIHCTSCEMTIRTLVGEVDGVAEVEADHQSNQVVVTYDESKIDDVGIRSSLADAGFAPV